MKAPKRLQRIILQLQPFNLNIHFVPGTKVVLADTLSRDYMNRTDSPDDNGIEVW